jgi:hypothetical protein
MKKWIIAFIVLTAVGVGCVAWWRYVRPQQQVSDLYRCYEHADGIAASYIHNYPVNDTLSLDVTLLEATTDSSWQVLCADFAISRVVEEMVQINPDLVFCRQVSRHDYTQVIYGDHPNAELLTISCSSKTLAIFHTHTPTEIRAVLYYTWPKQ